MFQIFSQLFSWFLFLTFYIYFLYFCVYSFYFIYTPVGFCVYAVGCEVQDAWLAGCVGQCVGFGAGRLCHQFMLCTLSTASWPIAAEPSFANVRDRSYGTLLTVVRKLDLPMSLFAYRYKCVIKMSSRTCYPHMGPDPSWRMSQACGEDLKDVQGRSSPWPPP